MGCRANNRRGRGRGELEAGPESPGRRGVGARSDACGSTTASQAKAG